MEIILYLNIQLNIGREQKLLFILAGSSIILLVLFFGLIINIKKRAKAERAAIQARVKLKESYKELEIAYEEVMATKNALYSRYEELKENRDKVNKLAYSDYLTGLPNRVALMERIENAICTQKLDEIIGVMHIDLDNFKNINDTLGHAYGDQMLGQVADRLKGILKEEDYLARFAGDEFVILTRKISDVHAYEARVEEIQRAFLTPFVVATKEFFITASIGIAISPKDGKNAHALIQNVDTAMYAAKEQGKNNYCFFDEAMNKVLKQQIEMQNELRKAIEEKQFVVYYQAQMNLDTDRIIGFEALIRWEHPTKGIIPPIQFIPIAEETGLIVSIGRFVLEEACRQLRQWEDEGYQDVMMAVNLSARQFKDKDFLKNVYEILGETKINPKHLEFEITETVALDDLEFTIEMITKLKDLGVSFALDDFGTGYSSLNYLKRLPVNNLKIDKSFLDTVLDNNSDQKIVRTMIDLARDLNIEVIAEGVEKSEQEQFLKTVNCGKAQGYLYSRPVPKREACEVLHKVNAEA
ncbi:MAG: EAL domain-containing protein [Lachnospiraceae bacterium]|nr:EAL domain-containing protein [Lachnospiraceae bacterium]